MAAYCDLCSEALLASSCLLTKSSLSFWSTAFQARSGTLRILILPSSPLYDTILSYHGKEFLFPSDVFFGVFDSCSALDIYTRISICLLANFLSIFSDYLSRQTLCSLLALIVISDYQSN
jgi:hypothetical protein